MAGRYIDTDNLKQRKHHIEIVMSDGKIYDEYDFIKFSDINEMPAVDVQEVTHGEWVKGETDRQYCSICHEVRPYYFKETLPNEDAEQKKLSLINWECPYCPNCGARMNEEIK